MHFESTEHSKMCNAKYQIRVKISELSISSQQARKKTKMKLESRTKKLIFKSQKFVNYKSENK